MIIFTTKTGSTYAIDYAENTLTRMRVGENSRDLRKDGESIPIIKIWQAPQVGSEAIFILDIRGDGVSTVRRTSEVQTVVIPDLREQSDIIFKKVLDKYKEN